MRAHIVENGIVTNTIEVESLDFLPGLVSAESGGAIGDRYEDGEFLPPPPPAKSLEEMNQAVDAERDRRIDSGFVFNGVQYQSRPSDRENIAGKALEAFMAIIEGAQPDNLRWANPHKDFAWIAADNRLVTMDAQTVVSFGKAASAHKEFHVFAGRKIKDMNPIPSDFTDDKWWV